MSADEIAYLRYVGDGVPDFRNERSWVVSVRGLSEVGFDGETAYFAAVSSPNAV